MFFSSKLQSTVFYLCKLFFKSCPLSFLYRKIDLSRSAKKQFLMIFSKIIFCIILSDRRGLVFASRKFFLLLNLLILGRELKTEWLKVLQKDNFCMYDWVLSKSSHCRTTCWLSSNKVLLTAACIIYLMKMK